MATGDGNGWVECDCGHRHWGRFGAAGLLLVRRTGAATDEDGAGGGREALLQLRASWTDSGGTWGLPGGAADSHEDATTAALREATEETALPPDAVQVLGERVTTDHGRWRYTVVIATPRTEVRPRAANAESDAVTWVGVEDVADLPLHRGLAGSWEGLRGALEDVDERVA